jgi:putative ABC transport system permease protein
MRLNLMSIFDALRHDARFAARTLLKAPGFTSVTVLTLALAIGATTAIFSIVNGVLLRPLPFASPERLVQVEEIAQVGGPGPVFAADLDEFRKQSRTLETFSGYSLTTRHLQGMGEPERLTTVVADQYFFSLLGVQALAGRTFGSGDTAPVVVISERLWERRFNRDPSVISRTIALDGNVYDPSRERTVIQRREHTVIGVMPARFQFPYGAASIYATALPEAQIDVWMLQDKPPRAGRVPVTARLRPGVTIEEATTELTLIEQRLDAMTSNPYRPTGVRLVPLVEEVVGPVRRSLWLLVCAVSLVLVAACANVANLLLARMAVRAREIVTRMALGATRLRLSRQLFTESVLLSLAGGTLGAAVAWWGMSVLIAVGAAKIPRVHEISLDWTVFAFMLLISVTTAVLFGLAPAIGASRADIHTVTKDAGGRATVGRGYGHIRDALVVAEIALAFVLAFGAAAVMRELDRLQHQDTGFTPENVLTMHITPRLEESLYYRIEERVRQVSGVESAGLIHMVPLQNWGGIGTFQVRGRPAEEASRLPTAELRSVTPGYFETLRIPVRRGRALAERDSLTRPVGIVINETMARQHFAGTDPVGMELDRGVIVGIVADVRQRSLDQPAAAQIYSAVGPSAGIAPDIGIALVVRTQRSPLALIDALRSAIREVQRDVAIFNVKTMEQIVADSTWELNLYRWLIGLFAALALVLTAIGLFGVISYGVASRTREFAIRLALGSNQTRLARLVLARGVLLTGSGLAVGAAASIAMRRLVASAAAAQQADVGIVTLISLLLLVIALAACVVPALRVARLHPTTVLREE